MKSFLTRLLLVGFVTAGAAVVQAQVTINYTSPAFEIGKDSTGTALDGTYTFALGSFGTFTPTSSNVADWATNFTALNSTTWITGGQNQYSGSGTVSNNTAPFTTSNQGVIWGYNTQTIGATTEWILITNANWTFPAFTDNNIVAWTSTDSGTYAALGTLSGTTGADPYIQTYNLASAVPEPSTYALFAGIACLGFMVARRRFVKV